MLNRLQGVDHDTVPTLGFNVETLQLGYATVQVFDTCGQQTQRDSWSMFFEHAHALVYVVDSNDIERIYESGTELQKILNHVLFPEIPILILANKQDHPRAATPHTRHAARTRRVRGVWLARWRRRAGDR